MTEEILINTVQEFIDIYGVEPTKEANLKIMRHHLSVRYNLNLFKREKDDTEK
jgi:hypothetical protein